MLAELRSQLAEARTALASETELLESTGSIIGRLKAAQARSERISRVVGRWVDMVWRAVALAAVWRDADEESEVSVAELSSMVGRQDVVEEGASQASGSRAATLWAEEGMVQMPASAAPTAGPCARRRRRRRTSGDGWRSMATQIETPVVGTELGAQTEPRRTGGRQRRERRRRTVKYQLARRSRLRAAASAFYPSFESFTEGAFLAAAGAHNISIGAAAA